MEQRTLTNGEFKVGIGFNPGKHAAVEKIKRMSADLIDAVEEFGRKHVWEISTDADKLPEDERPSLKAISRRQNEVGRLVALACTGVEHAAMDAVKAVTK